MLRHIIERWKFLYDSPHYQVSNLGKIRSIDRVTISRDGRRVSRSGKELTVRRSKKEPHLFVSVSFGFDDMGNNLSSTVYIHKAVADHFVPKPYMHDAGNTLTNYQYATHVVPDYENNTESNIIWITHSELMQRQSERPLAGYKSWKTRRELYGVSGTKKAFFSLNNAFLLLVNIYDFNICYTG